jgi:hypothetical protein
MGQLRFLRLTVSNLYDEVLHLCMPRIESMYMIPDSRLQPRGFALHIHLCPLWFFNLDVLELTARCIFHSSQIPSALILPSHWSLQNAVLLEYSGAFCNTSPSQVYIDLLAPRINTTFAPTTLTLNSFQLDTCKLRKSRSRPRGAVEIQTEWEDIWWMEQFRWVLLVVVLVVPSLAWRRWLYRLAAGLRLRSEDDE